MTNKLSNNTNKLSNNDYTKILEFYGKPIPKSKRLLKIEANKIMANKLCRCIKKLDPINESRSKIFLIIKDLPEENLNVKEKNMLHLKKIVQKKQEKIKNNYFSI